MGLASVNQVARSSVVQNMRNDVHLRQEFSSSKSESCNQYSASYR